MIEFKECATCVSNPGSPTLCASCFYNRTTINVLRDAIVEIHKAVDAASDLNGLEHEIYIATKTFEVIPLERIIRAAHARGASTPVAHVEGWKKGVLESIDKLTAFENSIGGLTCRTAIELLNILLRNPPEAS